MKTNDRATPPGPACAGLTGEALERHIFQCPSCRGQGRMSSAWEALRGDRGSDPLPAVDERFVKRVLGAVRQDASLRRRRRWLLAAAAVLLFFFAAGANSRSASAAPSTPEEIYAGVTTPSAALEGLLPE